MILKIFHKIKSKFDLYRSYFKLKLSLNSSLKKVLVNTNPDVIISLTSYWKRFNTLQYTLESLMRQKAQTSFTIHLVLSQEDINKYGGYPENLKRYIDAGLNLIIIEENLKSYKKAYYTYNLGKPIITVDDDIYYPSWWLNQLINEVKKTPDMVLAYRGHYMLKCKSSDGFEHYSRWLAQSDNYFDQEGKYSFLPTGTSGVYYPVGSLKGLFESKELFLKLCPHADDFWLKYLTTINGFKARRIQPKNIHFPIMSKDEGLFNINVAGGQNDIQFNNLIEHSKDFLFKIQSDVINSHI